MTSSLLAPHTPAEPESCYTNRKHPIRGAPTGTRTRFLRPVLAMARQFSLRFILFLFGSDLAMVVLALLLATRLRALLPFGKVADPSFWTVPLPVYLMGIVIWAVAFVALDVYCTTRLLGEHFPGRH